MTVINGVEIVEHTGRDVTLKTGERLRQDSYKLRYDGRSYRALAGAAWDSKHHQSWRLEHLWRTDRRSSHGAPKMVEVMVPKGYRAWNAIAYAILQHRRDGGYAKQPEPAA